MSNFFKLLKYKYNMKANLKRRASYVLKEGDTLESVCKKFDASVSTIKLFNMITSAKAGDIIFFPENNSSVYVVKPTDTFKGVAEKLKISESELYKLTNTTRLFIGQRIEY